MITILKVTSPAVVVALIMAVATVRDLSPTWQAFDGVFMFLNLCSSLHVWSRPPAPRNDFDMRP